MTEPNARDEKRPAAKKLNVRQQKFVAAYLRSGNATQAAREAGYSGSDVTLSTTGSRMLRNARVAAEIEAGRAALWDLAEQALRDVLRDKKQPAARIKAVEVLARVQGRIAPTKHQHHHMHAIEKEVEETFDPTADGWGMLNAAVRALRSRVAHASIRGEVEAILAESVRLPKGPKGSPDPQVIDVESREDASDAGDLTDERPVVSQEDTGAGLPNPSAGAALPPSSASSAAGGVPPEERRPQEGQESGAPAREAE